MDIKEIVYKIIGEIQPIGETNEDNRRFENLKEMCDLVDKLICDIDTIVFNNSNSQQYSIKRSVDYINKFLDSLGISE